jgi:2,3-dihydroxy-p-cumate/2,3-dihydroxybenzoate 3,4-dioxygenase
VWSDEACVAPTLAERFLVAVRHERHVDFVLTTRMVRVRTRRVMSLLDDVRFVRLGSSDLDASVRFATEILGLQLVRRDANRAFLRAGAGQDHHLVYVRNGGVVCEALAFEATTQETLDALVSSLSHAGHVLHEATSTERDERCVSAMYSLVDPTGNRIELVRGLATEDACTYTRDAGITSFSHVGLRTTNAVADERFWTGGLGARVSDWIGQAALIRTDEVHHRVALFPSSRAGVQHVNFQVAGIDDVMRAYYFLRERGVKIVFGPGRHPTSSAMFVYFQGPDDIVYEYSTGVRLIMDEAGHEPRRFPFEPQSFCMWGSRPDIPEFRTAEPLLVAGVTR